MPYTYKHIAITLLVLLALFAKNAAGQSNPTAQALPYSQNFNSFTGSVSTYPAGWQGWAVGGSISTTLSTAAPSADQALVTGNNNGSSTAFVGDMVGKMGILSTGSNIRSICLAVNTTGLSNIQVTYTVGTLGQIQAGRIDEMNLQYRLGTSGTFTTISGTTYYNSAANTINSGTSGTDPGVVSVTLPAACNGQAVVQLRWIYRDASGSGNRPSFYIDDVTVQAPTNYYSKSSGNLDATATWGPNTDGTGTAPANFTTAGRLFHIANSNAGTFSGSTWTVSGTGSRVLLDAGTDLTIGSSTTVSATINVAAGRTLTISNSSLPLLGALDSTSTVVFNGLTLGTPMLPYYNSNAAAVGANDTLNSNVIFGNLILNNTSVSMPSSSVDVMVRGNMTLSGASPLTGGDSTTTTNGYNIVTLGSLNQTISGSNNKFYVRNIDINNTHRKTGTVTLASNTPILASNSLRINTTGAANKFSDGGNTIKVFNNASMGGDAGGYGLTGTLYMAATSSSSNTVLRGYTAGSAADIVPAPVFNNITINNGSSQTVSFAPSTGGATISLSGGLNIASTGTGSTVLNANTVNIGGNFSHTSTTNTFTTTGSTVVFNGATAQTYSTNVAGGHSFNNLKIANGSTVTLSASMTVGGTLSLSSGVIVTGSNTLTLSSASTITGGSTSSFVNGSLSRAMPSSAVASMFYPVGDIAYSPIRINFTSGTYSGASVLVKATTGRHPSIATSGIDSANFVNRYWSVTPTSFSPAGTVTVDLSYNNPGDMVGVTANNNYFVRRFSASAWSTPSVTNSTSGTSPLLTNYTNAGGLASGTLAGDYVVGNRLCSGATGGTANASGICSTITSSATVTLSGASSGAGITYQWQSSPDNSTFNNISGATSSSYTDPSVVATTYYKCVVGCAFTGTVTSTTATVSVTSASPTITSVNASPNPICSGATLTLTSTGVTGATSYSWAGSGFSATTSTTTRSAITTAGAGTYTFTATNACGSATLTTAAVVVNTAPTSLSITASPSISVCSGNSFSLTASATSFATPIYSWRGPSSLATSTSSSTNPVTRASATTAMTGTYTLTAANTCGSSTITTTYTVNATPSAGAITPSSPGVQVGTSVTLSNPTATGTAIWSTTSGTGSVSLTASGVATGLSLGSATVNYTSSTAAGCQATATPVTIRINGPAPSITSISPQIAAPGATVTISGSNFDATPANNTVYFGATKASVDITSSTSSMLVVTVPSGALYGPLSVTTSANYTAYSPVPFTPIYNNSGFQSNVINFKNALLLPAGATPYSGAIGDINGDGKPDLVVNNSASIVGSGAPTISVYKNVMTGTGIISGSSFTLTNTLSAGLGANTPNNVKLADLDGDGKLDIVVALSDNASNFVVYRNTTTSVDTPTFSSNINVSAPYAAVAAIRDMDGDGDPEIIVSSAAGLIAVLPSTSSPGTISFGSPVYISAGSVPSGICVADLDGDGLPDIAAVNSGYVSPSVYNGNSMTIVRNTSTYGSISFGAPTTLSTGSGPLDVAAGDINNDGKSDLVVTNVNDRNISIFINNSTTGTLTASSFASRVNITTGDSATGVALADINGDGKLDIVVSNNANNNVSVFRNLVSGSTVTLSLAPSVTLGAGSRPITVTIGDLDGDGYPDVVTGNRGTFGSPGNAIAVVKNYPLPPIGTTSGAAVVCAGNSTTYSNTVSGGNWTVTNAALATITSTGGTLTGIAAGVDTVVYYTIFGGDTSYVYTPVTVSPGAPTVTATASATTLCAGTTLSLTGTITGSGSYSWSGPDGFNSVALNPSLTVNVASSGIYSLVASNGCGTTTATTAAVTVNSTPAPTIAGTTVITIGNSTTLTITGNSGDVIYYSATGGTNASVTLDGSGVASFAVAPTTTTTYTIDSARSSSGCFVSVTGQTATVTVSLGCSGAPTAVSATASGTAICIGTTVTLSGSATSALTYQWSGPGGYSSTDLSPAAFTVNTASAGNYTFTATNACGSTATTVSITAIDVPASISASVSSTSVCVGQTLTLTGSATGATSYSWSGPGSYTATDAGPAAFTATTASAGIYTLTAANSCGSVTATTATVIINNTPTSVSAALSAASVCGGGSVTLTGNATNATSYTWGGPNGFTSTDVNPASFTVNTASAGVYTLTASNECGSTTAVTTTLSVISLPTSVTAFASSSVLCAGDQLTLSGAATDATSYSWSGPNSYTSTSLSPAAFTVNTASAGVYTLTASSSCGTVTATTAAITVNSLPTSVTASLSSAAICSGGTLTLTGAATNALSYSWSGPNGFTATDLNPAAITVGTNSAGVYTLSATNTCGTTTATTGTLSILGVPTAVTASATSLTVCVGSSLTLSGTATSATTYTWSGPNSYASTSLNPAAFTVNTASAGVYTLTASNTCGSVAATTSSVTVNPLPTASISGTASITSGSSTTLVFSGTANATVYYWNGSATTTTTLNGSGSSTVTVTPTVTTTYTLTSVTSVAGCSQSVTGSATITVTPASWISLTNAAPTYTQDFNGLATTGTTNTWTDFTTPLVGWAATFSGGSGSFPGTYRADDGTGTTGALYSYGTTGSSERALGSLASGTTGTLYYAARFKNNGTTNIVGLTVTYTGEQWRNNNNATAQSNTVDYQVGATGITSGTWTLVPALAFTTLQNTTTAAALNGNAAANRTANITTTISTTVVPGQEVWLRVGDPNDAGNDHGIAMDDLTVTAIYAQDYYSASTGNLDNTATWGTNTDGSGTHPSNFTTAGQVFHVANGNPGNISATTWTVSGGGAKVVLDASTDLAIGASTTIAATIDVAAGRTLTISNQTLPTFGTLNAASTIVYNGLTFTTTTVLPSTSVTYGNLVLNNTAVTMPASANTLNITGNLTLSGTSPFVGGDTTNGNTAGCGLVMLGSQNQTIAANGNTFIVRNFDINNTPSTKTGTVTLAANTIIQASNSLRMYISGSANAFSDGGNIVKVFNNASMGGDATGYNLTGTLYMAASVAGGNTLIRGYSAPGTAASTTLAVPVFNNITINNLSTATVSFAPTAGGATYTLKGNLNIASTGTGALILNPNTINIGGNFIHTSSTNVFTAGTSTVIFNGTGAQTYTTNVAAGNTFNNLTIANGSTLTLSGNMTVGATLSLSSGNIVTGSNTLSLGNTATITGGSASSYVNGSLSRAMLSTGSSSMTYPVGDVSYSPVKLTFSSVLISGSVLVKSTAGAHPSIVGSYVDTAAYVKRYWTITPTGVAPSTINIDLSYNSSDINGGGSNTAFILRQYNGSAWSTAPFVSNSTSGTAPLLANVTSTTGAAGSSFSGDYVAGNALCSNPVAGTAIASATTLCGPSPITLSLSGASSNSAIGYQWQSSDDGTTYSNISGATSSTYSVTPSLSTYYKCNVVCQLTGNSALTAAINIIVSPLPSSVVANASSTTLCAGQTLTLTGSASGATSYTWSGPGGFTSTDINPAAFTVGTASGGVYTLTATNSCGNTSATTTTIMVNDVPSAVAVTASSYNTCTGSTITLTGAVTGFATYSWAGPNGFTSTDLNPASFTVNTASAGVYTLTAANYCGTVSAVSTAVTVNVTPSPTISGTTLIGSGYTATLTFVGNSGDVVYYSWATGSSSVTIGAGGTAAVAVTPSSTTTYNIDSARSGAGCYASITGQTATVTVDLGCSAPPSAVTATLSSSAICVGGTLTLTGAATNALSYSWSGPNGFTSTNLTPAAFTVGTASAGVYTLSATNTCGTATATTATLSIINIPTSVTASATSYTVCAGSSLTLNGTASGATTYAWSGPNSYASTALNPAAFTVNTASAGVYTLTASNTCGTVVATTSSVTVNPLPTAAISGTASIFNGSSTTLVFSGTANATVYYWNGSATTTTTLNGSGSSTVTVTPTVTTTYTLTSVTSVAGCSQSVAGSATITVTTAPYISLTNVAPTYTQDFNGLATTGTTNTWTDFTTPLVGWAATFSGGSGSFPGTYRADDGTGTTGALYSYGTTGSSERALGSLASGTTGTLYYAARFKNNGTTNIVGLTVTYTGEQWRNNNNATAQSNTVDYQVGATGITSGTWTLVPALAFTTLQNTTTAAALNGNAAANRTANITTTISTTVVPGQEVWLRVGDPNDAGNDHGIAVDDLTVTAIYAQDYYSASTGNLDNTATWGTNTDGSGTHPSNFTTAGQVFHVANGNPGNISATTWTVSGGGAKIALDASTDLAIGASTTIAATIDVAAGRTLTISNQTLPTFGTLNTASTVVYNGLTFTTTTVLPSTSVTYGNLVLNNTAVTMPASANTLNITGNLTLSGTSPFVGGDTTNGNTAGCGLVMLGSQNQTITANGNTFIVRNFDINNTPSTKTGTVTLAANTTIQASNSLRMYISGSANAFSDGGNIVKVFNNASMGGDATGYNLTGTLYMAASVAGGNTLIRGYSAPGTAASTTLAVPVFNNITINNLSTATVSFAPTAGGATYTLKGNLNIASTGTGALILNPNTINIGGNFIHTSSTNVFTAGTSTVIFNGTGAQTYTTNVAAGNTFNNLTIANGSTLTLSGILNVSGTIGLINGVVVASGSSAVSLSAAASVSGGGSTSYVYGNLLKTMPSGGTTSMTYQVGDVTYSPVKLTFSSSVNSGSITVKSTAGAHPSIAGSYVDTAAFVNRYWTVTPSGVAPTTINLDLSYNSGDIRGGGSNGAFILRQFNGSSWSSAPFVSNSTSGTTPLLANVTTTTGISGTSYTGDYVAGNALCSTPSAGTATASPATVCSGASTTLGLSGASANSAIAYQWQSSPDGSSYTNISGATSASYSVIPSVTTYYRAQLTCLLTSNTATSTPVTVNTGTAPSSVTAAVSASAVCSGTSVSLTGSATGATTYSWSGPGGYAATALNPASFTVNTTSTGTYTLIASNSCGSVTATTATLNVYATPTAVTATPNATSLCSGNLLGLAGSATGATDYAWSGPAGFTSTQLSPDAFTVSTASSGIYTITAYNICGTVTATTPSITISPSPSAVTATASGTALCEGQSLTITGSAADATTYSWSGPNGYAATALNPAALTVNTLSSGVYTLTASSSCGTVTATTASVTVNAAPTSVTASASATTLCAGTTLTLAGSASGATSYTWNGPGGFSSLTNPATLTILSANAGVYTLTATSACGSSTATTTSVAVTTVPTVAVIAGTLSTTVGSSVSLTNSTPSGVWSSVNNTVATVSASGVVTGAGLGIDTIAYTVTNSCGPNSATAVVTVNPVIATSTAIWDFTGSTSGLASSSTSAAVPTSGCTSGIGNSNGTVSPIIGSTSVSSGYTGVSGTNNIGNAAAVGAFSTSSSAYIQFTLTPNTGYYLTVSGLSFGTRSTSTGPQAFAVRSSVDGYTTNIATGTIANTSTWSLKTPSISSVTGANNTAVTIRIYGYSGTGTATSGTVNWRVDDVSLTYAANPIPCSGTPSAGTLTGATAFCGSGSTSLTFAAGTTGSGISYQWSSSNTGTSTSFTPISGATSASYTTPTLTATTYYRVGTTCGYSAITSNTANAAVTINPLPGVPGVIGGPSTVCVGSTISLTDTSTSGTWSSSAPTTATVDASGAVSGLTAGTANISYTISNSCGTNFVIKSITVNPLPAAGSVVGPNTVCIGTSSLFTDTASGGVWTTSDAAIASVNSSGLVSGITSGTANITYTLTNTCGTAIATAAVTINTSPSAGVISGASTVCQSAQTTLSDGTPGGTWSSGDNTIATVSASGVVSGVLPGSVTIAYTVVSACGTAVATYPVTVNPLPATPAPISGSATVCQAGSTTLSDTSAGGTWTSSVPSVATVGSTTGIVYGVTGGSTNIVYTVVNGCGSAAVTFPVTVNPLPSVAAISGASSVCRGASITLTNTTSGGTWSTSASGTATVDASGVVTGVNGGSATISYVVTNACGATTASFPATVNTTPTVAAITGLTTIAIGISTTLSNATAGGIWTSSNTAIATISGSGTVTGTGLGIDTISYTVTNICGNTTVTLTETVLPAGTTGSALWDFTGSTSGLASSSTSAQVPTSGCTSGIGNSNGTVATPINGTSASSGYTGASGGNNIGNAAGLSSLSTSSPYIQVTLTPNAGYYLNITGVSFGSRSTSTGPQAYAVRSSIDGYSSNLATGTMLNNSTYVLFNPSFTSATGAYNTAVTLRIYGYNGSGSPATSTINWRVDDINVGYSVNPVPCSGTPATGTVTGATAICGSGAATLSFTPGTTLTGASYQWSSSDNVAGTFTPISGATSTTYSTGTLSDSVYYKVTTSCAYSGLSASTTVAGVLINPIPVVSVTSPVCAGVPVTASGAATYTWTPASGLSASTGATVIPSGTITATAYSVTGASTAGCTSTQVFTVNPAPVVTVTSTGGGTICDGSSVTLTAAGATDYSWSPATALSATTGASINAAPVSTTVYSVSGFNSTTGCSALLATTYTVSVGTPDRLTLGAFPEVCQSIGSVLLPFTIAGGTPATYSITWSTDATAAGYTNVTNAPLSGTYIDVALPISGATGTFTGVIIPSGGVCAGVADTIISTIYAYPVAAITSASSPCANHSSVIEIRGVAGQTVSFMVDSGSITTGTFGGDSMYVIPTGILTGSHNYTVIRATNAICVTNLDTVVYLNPIPMQWLGGTPGHETDWNTATNWSCGFVPTNADSVIINSVTNIPVLPTTVSATVNDLNIASGSVIQVNGAGVINVKGDIYNSGTVNGTGRVILNGSSAQKLYGIGTISNLELNNASGATIQPDARTMIGSALYLTSGTLATNDSLELLSNDTTPAARIAEIPASGAGITGRVKTDQYVQGGYRRFRFWGHSFSDTISLSQLLPYVDITGSGGSANGFVTTTTNNPSAFRYDPTMGNDTMANDRGWRPFTKINSSAADSNLLHPGQGIRLFFRGAPGEGFGWLGYSGMYNPSAIIGKMIGHVNQGPVSIPLKQGTDTVHQSYNQISNPYPSPVDIGTVLFNARAAGQIKGAAFYVWNPTLSAGGQYMSIPIGESAPEPYYIQANTSFQVKAEHNGAHVDFVESNKGASAALNLFRAPAQAVRFNIYDTNYHLWDMLSLQFNDKASDDEDKQLDATKPFGADLNFYSLSKNGSKLAIDARPYEGDKVIPLGIKSAYQQDFVLRAEAITVPTGGAVTLHDKLLNKYVELKEGTEYRFTISKDKATQGDDRFELNLKPTKAAVVKGLEVAMAPNPASDDVKITFTSGSEDNVSVRIMDVSGVSIYSQDLGAKQNGVITVPMSNFAAGVYMVELTQGEQKVTKRLVKE